MKIPFGKPFPGIDSVSLRDGVASGLTNGFINETGVDVESIPGQSMFTIVEAAAETGPFGLSRYFDGSTSNYLFVPLGTFEHIMSQCAWIQVSSLGTIKTIFGNVYDAGYSFRINAQNELEIYWIQANITHTINMPLTIAGGAAIDYLQVGVPLFVGCNITHNDSFDLGPGVIADFYAGLTAATIVYLGTDSIPGVHIASNGLQKIHIGGNGIWNDFATTQYTVDPFYGYIDRIGLWQGKNLTLAEFQEVAYQDGVMPPLVFQGESLQFFFEITGEDPEPNLSTAPQIPLAYEKGSVPTAPGIADTSRLIAAPLVGGKVDGLYETLEGVVLALSNGHVFTVNANGTYTLFTGDLLTIDTYPYWCEDGQHVFLSHWKEGAPGYGKIARLDMSNLTVTLLNQNTPSAVTHVCRSKGYLLCNGNDTLITSSVFDLAQVFDNSASLFNVVVLHDKPGWIVAAGQGPFAGEDNVGRLYLSKDNGITWTRILSLLIDNQFLALEYLGNGIVLAGTAYTTGRIFRSTNYGVNWTEIGQLGISTNINFIKKLTDTVVIAGTGGSSFGPPPQAFIPGRAKIYRSTDSGSTWTDAGPDFGYEVCAAESFKADGSVVVVSVMNDIDGTVQLLRSFDYCQTFFPIADPPDQFPGTGYTGFIQRVNNTTAIMANGFVTGAQKIWRTTDQGDHWTDIGPIPDFSDHAMPWAACQLADGSLLMGTAGDNLDEGGAQIWKSIDGGLTWFFVTLLEAFPTAAIQWGGLKETHIVGTVIATGRIAEGRDGTATAAKWQTAVGKNLPQGDVFFSEQISQQYESVDSWERFNLQAVPDKTGGVFTHRGLVYGAGPRSIEMNYSSGDAEFPWAVSDPALPFGLLAPRSWVSWDELDTIMYLTSTDRGVKVVQLRGRQQQGISEEYDQILNDRTIITQPQDAKAWAITIRGLRFYVISFQVDNLTLIYNLTQDHWARWAFWNGTSYEAALINAYCYSNEQKRHFFGDRRETGKIFTMDLTDLTDDGNPIVFEYTSGHVSRGGDSAKFPARYLGRYKRGFSIDNTIPEVLLSWRDDGRAPFKTERVLSLGETGDNEFYVHANRLGMYRLRQWRQRSILTKCRLIFSGADES